jgi:hypothetical protein
MSLDLQTNLISRGHFEFHPIETDSNPATNIAASSFQVVAWDKGTSRFKVSTVTLGQIGGTSVTDSASGNVVNLSDYATLSTNQTFTGLKVFLSGKIRVDRSSTGAIQDYTAPNVNVMACLSDGSVYPTSLLTRNVAVTDTSKNNSFQNTNEFVEGNFKLLAPTATTNLANLSTTTSFLASCDANSAVRKTGVALSSLVLNNQRNTFTENGIKLSQIADDASTTDKRNLVTFNTDAADTANGGVGTVRRSAIPASALLLDNATQTIPVAGAKTFEAGALRLRNPTGQLDEARTKTGLGLLVYDTATNEVKRSLIEPAKLSLTYSDFVNKFEENCLVVNQASKNAKNDVKVNLVGYYSTAEATAIPGTLRLTNVSLNDVMVKSGGASVQDVSAQTQFAADALFMKPNTVNGTIVEDASLGRKMVVYDPQTGQVIRSAVNQDTLLRSDKDVTIDSAAKVVVNGSSQFNGAATFAESCLKLSQNAADPSTSQNRALVVYDSSKSGEIRLSAITTETLAYKSDVSACPTLAGNNEMTGNNTFKQGSTNTFEQDALRLLQNTKDVASDAKMGLVAYNTDTGKVRLSELGTAQLALKSDVDKCAKLAGANVFDATSTTTFNGSAIFADSKLQIAGTPDAANETNRKLVTYVVGSGIVRMSNLSPDDFVLKSDLGSRDFARLDTPNTFTKVNKFTEGMLILDPGNLNPHPADTVGFGLVSYSFQDSSLRHCGITSREVVTTGILETKLNEWGQANLPQQVNMSNYAGLSGTNTFTGTNTFGDVKLSQANPDSFTEADKKVVVYDLDGKIRKSNLSSAQIVTQSGLDATLQEYAKLSDIATVNSDGTTPASSTTITSILQGYAALAQNNTFTQKNTFEGVSVFSGAVQIGQGDVSFGGDIVVNGSAQLNNGGTLSQTLSGGTIKPSKLVLSSDGTTTTVTPSSANNTDAILSGVVSGGTLKPQSLNAQGNATINGTLSVTQKTAVTDLDVTGRLNADGHGNFKGVFSGGYFEVDGLKVANHVYFTKGLEVTESLTCNGLTVRGTNPIYFAGPCEFGSNTTLAGGATLRDGRVLQLGSFSANATNITANSTGGATLSGTLNGGTLKSTTLDSCTMTGETTVSGGMTANNGLTVSSGQTTLHDIAVMKDSVIIENGADLQLGSTSIVSDTTNGASLRGTLNGGTLKMATLDSCTIMGNLTVAPNGGFIKLDGGTSKLYLSRDGTTTSLSGTDIVSTEAKLTGTLQVDADAMIKLPTPTSKLVLCNNGATYIAPSSTDTNTAVLTGTLSGGKLQNATLDGVTTLLDNHALQLGTDGVNATTITSNAAGGATLSGILKGGTLKSTTLDTCTMVNATTLNGATTVNNALTVGGTNATLLGGALTVTGLTTLKGGATVTGTLSATSTISTTGSISASGNITAGGNINANSNLVLNNSYSLFLGINGATLKNEGGINSKIVTFNGTWRPAPSAVMGLSTDGSANITAGATNTNTATLNGTLTNAGTISGGTISGATFSGGTISGATFSGTLANSGTISGGTISGGIISGATLSGTTQPAANAKLALSTDGTVNITAGATNTSTATLSGTLANSGTISGGTISGARLSGTTQLAASAMLALSTDSTTKITAGSNTATLNGTITATGATVTGANITGGTISNVSSIHTTGSATVNGSVTVSGAVVMKGGCSLTGTLSGGTLESVTLKSATFDNNNLITFGNYLYGLPLPATIRIPASGSNLVFDGTLDGGHLKPASLQVTGATTLSDALAANGGLSASQVKIASTLEGDQKLVLYDDFNTFYGMGISANLMSYTVPDNSRHGFFSGTSEKLFVNASGATVSGGLTVSGATTLNGNTTLGGTLSTSGTALFNSGVTFDKIELYTLNATPWTGGGFLAQTTGVLGGLSVSRVLDATNAAWGFRMCVMVDKLSDDYSQAAGNSQLETYTPTFVSGRAWINATTATFPYTIYSSTSTSVLPQGMYRFRVMTWAFTSSAKTAVKLYSVRDYYGWSTGSKPAAAPGTNTTGAYLINENHSAIFRSADALL